MKNKKITTITIIVLLFFFLGIFFLFKNDDFPSLPKEVSKNEHEENIGKEIFPQERKDVPLEKKLYDVVKVVDGDTIAVDIDGKKETLRLIGINTPETVDPRKPVECFGKEASAKAHELLDGKKVSLESDPTQGERDKYDRLLRYVFLEDGRNYNKVMIEEGYAYEYTYNVPYKYQSEFKQAQKEAEEAKRGLWADDTCSGKMKVEEKTEETLKENIQIIPKEETKSDPKPVVQTNSTISDCECSNNTKDCGDFSTHDEAQVYYQCCMDKVGKDIHELDGDNDGNACETLP